MSMTLWIVISAVVIVVVALVILTIFGSSMGGVSNIVEFRKNCEMVGKTSCGATGFLPLTWDQKVKVGDDELSCADVVTPPNANEDNPCGDWKVKEQE